MRRNPQGSPWKSLDTDLHRISQVELATAYVARPLVGFGLALAFLVLAGGVASLFLDVGGSGLVVIVAAVFGAYMALNIGANDVANNMGPAVGAKVLTVGVAIVIAALCETAGALLAGGDVVATISTGIIDPASVMDNASFTRAMMAALISAALFVNFATWVGAPVSTTHSVVGGVMGAGVAAAGLTAINWPSMAMIATSWMISPVISGGIAALVLAFIKARIVYRDDKIAAARVWVPVLIGVMAGVFTTYLAIKGLQRVVDVALGRAVLIGIGTGLLAYAASRPLIVRQSVGLENRTRSLKALFGVPLVFAAALLSFAHGANDVANAVGPLAAIVHVTQVGSLAASVAIPLWVLVIGALGISFGLFLFGPKLIRMVGNQITKLNPMRAYCVSLSTAITVIIASWLGLPVSSTHIAVGGVFGVGFYREWYMERRLRRAGTPVGKVRLIAREERRRRKLVRRSHFMTIIAAWVITVPAAAVMSALIYGLLGLVMA